MGVILPVRQHGERLLSGMAPKPPNDRRGRRRAVAGRERTGGFRQANRESGHGHGRSLRQLSTQCGPSRDCAC